MPERVPIIIMLAAGGLVGLLGGLVVALSSQDASGQIRTLSFLGVGVFCLSALFLFAGSSVFPRSLSFDNGTGWLTVPDRPGVAAAIPYDGISGITVCRTIDDRIARFGAGIDLARGGRWELYTSTDQRRAERYAEQLRGLLDLKAPVRERPQVTTGLTPQPSGADSVLYAWKRRTKPSALILSFLVIASFDAIIVGAWPRSSGPVGQVAAIVIGAAFLLGALLLVLRSLGQRVGVDIGRGTITVEQRSPLTRARVFSVPLSQIAQVDLTMRFSRAATRISLIRPDEVGTFLRYRQGTIPPRETLTLVPFLRGLADIDVSALPVPDRIVLAEALREAVAHASRTMDPIR
jgi:hypothetical protein